MTWTPQEISSSTAPDNLPTGAGKINANFDEMASHINDPAPHTGHEDTANKGQPNGYAALDINKKILASNLPTLTVVSIDCGYMDGSGGNVVIEAT